MIQESPAEIYINTNSITQNIRCTLRCGKFQHEKTVIGHFKYVRPISRVNWTNNESEIVSQQQTNILGSAMSFIINYWKEMIFGAVAIFASLILLWFLKQFVGIMKGFFK